jgi:hypothetical protein
MFLRKNTAIEIFEIIVFTLLFLGATLVFFNLDKNFLIDNQYFPWDSYHYNTIAKNYNFNNFLEFPKAELPFAQRVVFPIVYLYLSKLLNIKLIYSASIVNIFFTWISFLFFFKICKEFKISRLSKWIIIISFLILWKGPLRMSIYYPGSSFGFEVGMFSIVVYSFFLNSKKKWENKFLIILSIFLIIFSTFQRGIVIFFLSIIPILQLILMHNCKISIFSSSLLFKRSIYFLTWLISYIFINLITNGYGEYSIAKHFLKYGYLALNFSDFLYPFYLIFGPFFVFFSIFIIINFNFYKKIFLSIIADNKKNFVFFIILFSIILSKIGGESDRPIMWFWIWFYLVAGIFLDKFLILKIKYSKLLLFVIVILWTRVLIPALPPLTFSSIFYKSDGFVYTNYDDKLFYGLPFLKKYRNELETISVNLGEPYQEIYHQNKKQLIQVPTNKFTAQCKDNFNARCWVSPYIFPYKSRINDIPFPLGYLHNQRTAEIDNTVLGESWVRLIYNIQWLLLSLVLFFVIKIRKIYNK